MKNIRISNGIKRKRAVFASQVFKELAEKQPVFCVVKNDMTGEYHIREIEPGKWKVISFGNEFYGRWVADENGAVCPYNEAFWTRMSAARRIKSFHSLEREKEAEEAKKEERRKREEADEREQVEKHGLKVIRIDDPETVYFYFEGNIWKTRFANFEDSFGRDTNSLMLYNDQRFDRSDLAANFKDAKTAAVAVREERIERLREQISELQREVNEINEIKASQVRKWEDGPYHRFEEDSIEWLEDL